MIIRRRVAAACAAGAFLLLAPLSACGGSDDSVDAVAGSSTTAGETTTTTDDDATTTTAADDATTTTEGDGGEPLAGGDDIEADEDADGDGWDLSPSSYRGQDGLRIAYRCSPDGRFGSLWGTETYTDDSSVCTAAVHAGLITEEEGGRVVIEIAAGEATYEGSEANGADSSDYGAWSGSFTFPTS